MWSYHGATNNYTTNRPHRLYKYALILVSILLLRCTTLSWMMRACVAAVLPQGKLIDDLFINNWRDRAGSACLFGWLVLPVCCCCVWVRAHTASSWCLGVCPFDWRNVCETPRSRFSVLFAALRLRGEFIIVGDVASGGSLPYKITKFLINHPSVWLFRSYYRKPLRMNSERGRVESARER